MKKAIVERLVAAGLRLVEAKRKAKLFERASLRLKQRGETPASSQSLLYVPGRIEVLGKHTDYAGGRSLLCAVERGVCAVINSRNDLTIRIADALRDQEYQFALSVDLNTASQDWSVYPKTVARRVARNFVGSLRGLDIVFASDLPHSAGLSSSSALVVATFLALWQVNDLLHHPEYRSNIKSREDLATFLGCMENGQSFRGLSGDSGVGTFGGSEDHTALLCSRPGWLSQFRFCPARLEKEVQVPAKYVFAIGMSGVIADKTGSARQKYNHASLVAKTILAIWNEASGRSDATLFDAATHAPDGPDSVRQILSESQHSSYPRHVLLARFEQFFSESSCHVPGAADALARNDLEEFGNCVDRSQAGAERQLGNQTAETAALARSARELGASAASAFGAGFGGSVWALVQSSTSEDFLSRWKERYCRQFPSLAEKSGFFVTAPGSPALFL